MKITKLEINNFRALKSVAIPRLDPRVNLFVGINGAGKSSVLDALAILLSWFTARTINPKGNGRLIARDDIRIGSDGICSLGAAADNGMEWSLVRSLNPHAAAKSDLSALNAAAKALAAGLEEQPGTPLPVIVHYKVNRSVTEIPLRVRKTVHHGRARDLWDDAMGSASFKRYFSWYKEQEDLENERIRDDRHYRDRALEAVRDALSRFFPGYDRLRIQRSPRAMVLHKNGTRLNISQLSDGEKCYVALVCDLTRRLALADPDGRHILDASGIVLIDEVDLHLHPQWQSEVVSRLTGTFPNCQFFLSTHSPLVSSDAPGAVYKIVDGELVDEKSYGKESSQLLTSLFDMDSQRSPRVHAIIKQAYDAIHSSDTQGYQFLAGELARMLGSDDTALARLKLEFLRMQSPDQ